MDDVQLAVMGSLIGTLSIVLVYLYLYALYRERYLGIWTASWIILLSRSVLFDSGLLTWKQSLLGITTYQMLIIVSAVMFVWGTRIFMNKPLHRWWLYSSISISIVSVTINILCASLHYKLLLPVLFGVFVCIWTGVAFIRHLKLQGMGHLITGYAFILWGISSLILPFTINITWLLPWVYSLGGVLRLAIAVGTLMVYFEKTKTDLVNKETQYRLLADNAIDVIYYYQLIPEAKLQYISPSVLAVTGYPPAAYYADNSLIFKQIHSEDQPLINAFINHLPHAVEVPLTLRLLRSDNTTLWIEQKCVPIYDNNGDFIAVECIVRDITIWKKLEKMSTAFDRMNMVGNMAATVAHEIRNPMTTVRGYLQILGRRQAYQSDKEKFQLMIEEIDRANDIIREYLSLSRERLVDLKNFSLNDIIQALFPLIQADAIASKVSAYLELTLIPNLMLDENAVRQLLLNLVRNSIEAMPTGGKLVIRTGLEDDKVVLSVSDQGPGIPAHILDHLGTPFITTKDAGTGLGLPICYQIAHRHHAAIKVNTSNAGTTFSVYFNPIIL